MKIYNIEENMNIKKKKSDIQNLTEISLCVALLCVTSYLVVPLPFTPIVLSLHTIVVNLIGLILQPKKAGLTILLYLLMGSIGLPVFSAGTGGVGKLLSPTGGFYFGFLFAVVAVSFCRGKKPSFFRHCVTTILVGIPIQHFFAILFMYLHNGGNVKSAFLSVSLPFLVGDIVKCVMASSIATALNRVLKF